MQQVVQVAERLQKLPRRLFADPRNAGDVVRGISHQAQKVHYVAGFNTKTLLDLGCAQALVLHGIQDRRVLGYQLAQVLVAGDQHHVAALCLKALCQGTQNVVRLVTLKPQHGDVQRLDESVNVGNLHLEIVRHRRPVGLVVGILLVPESRAALVERHAKVRRFFLLHQLLQHVLETEHRLGGHAG